MPGKKVMVAVALVLLATGEAGAERIKDLAVVHGVRSNQLFGYGLVTGLMGTGDSIQSRFTFQSLAALLGRMGVRIDPRSLQVRNVAAVMVTAELPPFARAGSRIDVVVSSIGNARSIQGGTLILTPLKAVDGNVYAVVQGSILVGGFQAESSGASRSKNHTTVGRIPQGALVEREVPFSLAGRETLQLDLLSPDFTTAARIIEAVNQESGAEVASAQDPGTIQLAVPEQQRNNLVGLIARIENLEVSPDTIARVVINERTGTVVLGNKVQVASVAISHGNLHVEVVPNTVVSQPAPFSQGETVVAQQDRVRVQEDDGPIRLVEQSATLGDVVRALNAIGATPRDLIEILQAMRAAGALQAKLEIL